MFSKMLLILREYQEKLLEATGVCYYAYFTDHVNKVVYRS